MEHKRDSVKLSFESTASQDSNATGEKPPIILLHGVTNSKETWKKLMQPIAVATGRKVFAYDARNHGDSGWSDQFGYEIMQEDLLQFMDGLQAERAVLIGHSMGGKTAMYFALKWPERVEKLIVEDITPKPVKNELRTMAERYLQLLQYTIERIPAEMKDLSEAKIFVHKFLQDVTSQVEKEPSSRQSDNDGSDLPIIQYENGKFGWKINLKAIQETFFKGSGSAGLVRGVYEGPALLLWGTQSPYKVTTDREFILEHFPGARFRAVEGATHQIHDCYRDVFLDEVVHFINDAR